MYTNANPLHGNDSGKGKHQTFEITFFYLLLNYN